MIACLESFATMIILYMTCRMIFKAACATCAYHQVVTYVAVTLQRLQRVAMQFSCGYALQSMQPHKSLVILQAEGSDMVAWHRRQRQSNASKAAKAESDKSLSLYWWLYHCAAIACVSVFGLFHFTRIAIHHEGCFHMKVIWVM